MDLNDDIKIMIDSAGPGAVPPEGGAERQYYFIKAAGKLAKALFDEGLRSGAALERYGNDKLKKLLCDEAVGTFHTVTFGCQMNARDSEKLSGILEAIGYEECEDELDADLVIFNTCTIRENANEHLYGRLGRLKQIKKHRPDMLIAICGCMMQEKDEVEKIARVYPYVDIMFGTHNLYTFAELIYTALKKRQEEKKRRPLISVWESSGDIVEDLPQKRKFPFKQGVNISFGCDNFCSYCIVPYVRGREKSRKKEDILSEVERLGREGVKEIMLLGQNVNSYGRGLSEKVSFANLLEAVDELSDKVGIERIRFMTSHPKDLSDELIEVMAKGKHIMRQFHLPLQSGSDRILKLMNRHYDSSVYYERAMKLKKAVPDISISTDIIVGFPGETEEDFEATLRMVEAMRYDAAYTFLYSERNGTPAVRLKDKVDDKTAKERFGRLLALQNAIAAENCEKLVGKTLPVLFEEVNEKDRRLLSGRLENNAVVHVEAPETLIGRIADVELTKAHGFYYTGILR